MQGEYEEKIIEEFMGDDGRAGEWRAMRGALRERLRTLRAERSSASLPDAISTLDRRIAHLAEQIAALEVEEAVSQFVEDSVRAAIRGSARVCLDDEDDEGEI